ncbi:MAG: ATP-grasp domain-containing protein [Victivallales bacterium]|nr:ATP-grasp domain-containing protein [Victivallales bacterium]
MKAFVIAGGVPQIELIKQLKSRGITTILADESPNAVARPYCDIFYRVNIFDIPAIKEIAEKEKVDFLLTVCADQVLLVVAEVSERLGLPCYIDFKTAQDVSDKIRMKRIFKEIGVPTTDYMETDHLDISAISHLHYPLVVKPVDAYSSKGVRKADNEEELKKFYEDARKISRSGGVIVEEFFKGDEISVDAFVVNGKAKILAMTNSEKVKYDDRFVIFRGRYPVAASSVVIKKIEEIAQKIAVGFGLVNSPLLIQLLNNGDDVSVLEFCARTGGNMKWLLIKYSCGVDVITATIDITLGKAPDLELKDTGHKIVVNDFIYCHPGVFDHFEGFDKMQEQGFINEFHAVRIKGTEIRGVNSSSDRIAGMNIVANSVEEFNAKEKTILENVRVIDANGNDIMRRDLLPELK